MKSENTEHKIRVVITGSTGMVGEGVMLECLNSNLVSEVLIVNRRPSGFTHPKLKERILPDFFNPESIAADIKGYDVCLFCLGVSSVGMSEEKYRHLTYDLTMGFARVAANANPDNMQFLYISGAGTDSTENGRMMWARIKGKTENDLRKLPFSHVYAYRPGMLKAVKGQKNTWKAYPYFAWLYPVLKLVAPNTACTISELAQSMIRVSAFGFEMNILEVKDIIQTSTLEA